MIYIASTNTGKRHHRDQEDRRQEDKKSDNRNQPDTASGYGNQKRYTETPKRNKRISPRKIFRDQEVSRENKEKPERKNTGYMNRNQENKINQDIEKMNLEILLMNTLTISAWKVQMVFNQFMCNKPYTS